MTSFRNNLTEGKVSQSIIKLTIPMIFGTLSLVVFNITDTYFIGQLGSEQLAAVSFTFPVVLIINSLALGMGIGTSSLISRAFGSGDKEGLIRIATDSIILSWIFVIVTTIIGLNIVDQTFTVLGADGKMLIYIREYMSIWFYGMPFVVIPMVGNSIIRALGDTKTPSIVMMVAAGVNVILDPLLIFGVGIFPELGIGGAALATVISRMITFTFSLYIMIVRERIIKFRIQKIISIIDSWKKILYVAIPAALVRMITPLSTGIVTRLLSQYGNEAVAGYGVGTRIEFFTLAFINAMSSIMVPFAGQNYGAGKIDRIREGMRVTRKMIFIYGIGILIILNLTARFIAPIFNNSVEVQRVTILYLSIIPIGYGFQGMLLNNVAILNAINKPIQAAGLSALQMTAIYLPIALMLANYFGITGVFSALVVAYTIGGTVMYWYTWKSLQSI
ncbi:MAG: MATE efflux family protein [Clostridiales bacterium 38_11]|nr:MAG: MATE efflux family protein [Clostridiales bacterium 38_11]HBH12262.1 MATE family efflux transporter [Clostridiales bacterium]